MVRVFRPGLLSIVGTTAPFGLALAFLTASYNSCSSIGCLFGIVLGLAFGFAGMVLLGFSIALLLDFAHHRIWGAIVALLYGLGIYSPLFLILLGLAFSSDAVRSILAWSGVTAWALGLVGGLWGFFSGTSWTSLGVGKGLVGSTGRIFFGGLISFVSVASLAVSIFLLAPLVLLLGPLFLRVGSKRSRTVAVVLLGGSLATVLPVAIFLTYTFLTFGGWAGYDTQVASYVGILLGGLLAGLESMRLLARRQPETQNLNLTP